MKRFTSIPGEFACKICGTVYRYSDLKDACEGTPYWASKPDSHHDLLDRLNAAVGEMVIVTQYHGETYAQPPYRSGLFLSYRWEKVIDRRVIPGCFSFKGENYRHSVEYRIGERSDLEKQYGVPDRWDVTEGVGDYSVGYALGPTHIWSRSLVEEEGNVFPDYVIGLTEGLKTPELLQRKANEGYQVYGPDGLIRPQVAG